MVQWLLSWFRRGDQLYSDRQRLLFRFWDGQLWRRADIMEVQDRIAASNLPALIALARMQGGMAQETAERARARIDEVICQAFGVQIFDGSTGRGLTRKERLELLYRFQQYVAALKKNMPGLPASSGPAPPAPSPASSTTTNSPSAAGWPPVQPPAASPSPDQPASPSSAQTSPPLAAECC